jgi:hypothetical protein
MTEPAITAGDAPDVSLPLSVGLTAGALVVVSAGDGVRIVSVAEAEATPLS